MTRTQAAMRAMAKQDPMLGGRLRIRGSRRKALALAVADAALDRLPPQEQEQEQEHAAEEPGPPAGGDQGASRSTDQPPPEDGV